MERKTMMHETKNTNRFSISPADISGKVHRLANGWIMIEETIPARIPAIVVGS